MATLKERTILELTHLLGKGEALLGREEKDRASVLLSDLERLDGPFEAVGRIEELERERDSLWRSHKAACKDAYRNVKVADSLRRRLRDMTERLQEIDDFVWNNERKAISSEIFFRIHSTIKEMLAEIAEVNDETEYTPDSSDNTGSSVACDSDMAAIVEGPMGVSLNPSKIGEAMNNLNDRDVIANLRGEVAELKAENNLLRQEIEEILCSIKESDMGKLNTWWEEQTFQKSRLLALKDDALQQLRKTWTDTDEQGAFREVTRIAFLTEEDLEEVNDGRLARSSKNQGNDSVEEESGNSGRGNTEETHSDATGSCRIQGARQGGAEDCCTSRGTAEVADDAPEWTGDYSLLSIAKPWRCRRFIDGEGGTSIQIYTATHREIICQKASRLIEEDAEFICAAVNAYTPTRPMSESPSDASLADTDIVEELQNWTPGGKRIELDDPSDADAVDDPPDTSQLGAMYGEDAPSDAPNVGIGDGSGKIVIDAPMRIPESGADGIGNNAANAPTGDKFNGNIGEVPEYTFSKPSLLRYDADGNVMADRELFERINDAIQRLEGDIRTVSKVRLMEIGDLRTDIDALQIQMKAFPPNAVERLQQQIDTLKNNQTITDVYDLRKDIEKMQQQIDEAFKMIALESKDKQQQIDGLSDNAKALSRRCDLSEAGLNDLIANRTVDPEAIDHDAHAEQHRQLEERVPTGEWINRVDEKIAALEKREVVVHYDYPSKQLQDRLTAIESRLEGDGDVPKDMKLRRGHDMVYNELIRMLNFLLAAERRRRGCDE